VLTTRKELLLGHRDSDGPTSAYLRAADGILSTPLFKNSARKAKFLRFVVEEAVLNNDIKEVTIGIEIFRHDYDPAVHSDVRVAAREVRKMLRKYYRSEGRNAEVLITLPAKGYRPSFFIAESSPLARLAAD
jgi:hypothetical protein